MRLRARTDSNQKSIVEGLRKFGRAVIHLHQIGKGVPDLLVFNQQNKTYYLLEIKPDDAPTRERNLNDLEKKFHAEWPGPIGLAHTLEEAIRLTE